MLKRSVVISSGCSQMNSQLFVLCVRQLSCRCYRYGVVAGNLQSFKRHYTNKNILKLHDRGLLQDVFPEPSLELQNLLSKRQCIYAGFDPTAPSLHIGNLLVLMVLLHSQRGGHEVLSVVGGATALVGDPSGRTTERAALNQDVVDANATKIVANLYRIFDNHQKYFWHDVNGTSPLMPVKVLNNLSWYSKRNVVEFLSTTGRHLRMGRMLSRQSVQTRLNNPEGMSYAEFSYQAFQAYDWLHLYEKFNCVFQVGGSDQMGNMYAGHDLISRVKGAQCYGLTVPLIKSETGDKLGKSAGNTVWLDSNFTSPFEFYQFFLRIPDAEVENYLKMYTFLSLGEVQQLMENHKSKPEGWKAQKKLAEQLTMLVHGEDGLQSAKRTSNVLYNGTAEMLARLTEKELHEAFSQATSVSLLLQPGITILQLVMQVKCFGREKEARSIAAAGGLHINYRKAENLDYVLVAGEHILPSNYTVIRIGKRNFYLVKWIQ